MLKYLIDIPKIFENKKYLECRFKLTLLSQNNSNFIYNIKNLLDFNDEKALKIIEKNVSNIDYSNPFLIIYLHEIINNIANRDIEIKYMKEKEE